MIAESAAQVVSLLAPLLVVVLVAAVLASGGGSAREEAEAQVDARAREWARYVFGSEADDDGHAVAPPSRRVLVVARQDGCG
ncbi:hypothetical protein E2562_001425 [Oryza meyeriana var. granulata]|uniref:Uncharacterized protein n=1 Tax=Oryza meyeriana var. granulata TaxID=110450 RepID=A0A6G1DDA7_9ORYZ|nr:hypothetical protein E2562_001425 [Oryza meyeriana var. granulata]